MRPTTLIAAWLCALSTVSWSANVSPAPTTPPDPDHTIWIDSVQPAADGVTDDAAKFAALAASFGGKPNVIRLTAGKVYRVSGLSLPAGTVIEGEVQFPDDPANQSSRFAQMGGLALDATGTIALHSGSGLKNMVIYRAGMTFPAADSSRFAGTAISCASDTRPNGPFGDNLLILGFNLAVSNVLCDRPNFTRVFGDDVNGLLQRGSGDTSIYERMRFWPYATVGFPGFAIQRISGDGAHVTADYTLPRDASSPRVGDPIIVAGTHGFDGNYTITDTPAPGRLVYAATTKGTRGASGTIKDLHLMLDRPGTAFRFEDQTDDTHLVDTLSFAYHRGYVFFANGNIFANDLWQDPATPADQTQIGFTFGASIGRTTIGNISANGGMPTILFDNANMFATVSIANAFVSDQTLDGACIFARGGNNQIGNLQTVSCKRSAIDIAGAAHLQIGNAILMHTGLGTTTPPVRWLSPGATTDQLKIANLTTDLAPGTPRDAVNIPALPALRVDGFKSALRLPLGSNHFALTGRGTIEQILGGAVDREIVLTTADAGVVVLGAGGNIRLTNARSFGGAAGATLALRCAPDGLWHEEWRSAP